jgi:hypothetical protein
VQLFIGVIGKQSFENRSTWVRWVAKEFSVHVWITLIVAQQCSRRHERRTPESHTLLYLLCGLTLDEDKEVLSVP